MISQNPDGFVILKIAFAQYLYDCFLSHNRVLISKIQFCDIANLILFVCFFFFFFQTTMILHVEILYQTPEL